MYFFDPAPYLTRPVLFLHGLGTNLTSWNPQIQAMIDAGFRPIVPDLPGFGETPNIEGGWSLAGVSEELGKFLDHLELKQVDLIGLSMGGVIAQQFAIDQPERIRRMVLTATFPNLRPDNFSQALYLGKRFVLNYFRGRNRQAAIVANNIFPGEDQAELRKTLEEQILAADPEAYRAATMELTKYQLGNRLKDFNKPVLVIAGELDHTALVKRQFSLNKYIPNCETVMIHGAGHGTNIDKPSEFNSLVIEFLSR